MVVELAISLPLLLLVMFSTLEICSAIKLRQSLAIAAYEGALVAVVPAASSDDVQSACQFVLVDRGVNSGLISIEPAGFATAPAGSQIRIAVSAPRHENCVLFGGLFGAATTVSQAVFIKEFD